MRHWKFQSCEIFNIGVVTCGNYLLLKRYFPLFDIWIFGNRIEGLTYQTTHYLKGPQNPLTFVIKSFLVTSMRSAGVGNTVAHEIDLNICWGLTSKNVNDSIAEAIVGAKKNCANTFPPQRLLQFMLQSILVRWGRPK